MRLEHRQFKSTDDALKACGSLLCFDLDGTRPFLFVWQELLSCISKSNYVVQTADDEPVGFATWINLNRPLGEVYTKNLRFITPMEHDTGKTVFLHNFCAGLGNADSLLKYILKHTKNNQLAYVKNNVKYDLHKSEFSNALRLLTNE